MGINENGIGSEQLYVIIEAGLLIKTLFTQPKVMDSCIGKKVKVEMLEMDHLLVDGEYYEIIGWQDGLAHVREVKKDKKFHRLVIEILFDEDTHTVEEVADIGRDCMRGIDKMGISVNFVTVQDEYGNHLKEVE